MVMIFNIPLKLIDKKNWWKYKDNRVKVAERYGGDIRK